MQGLYTRPDGWRFDEVQRTLGISERTLLRYLAALRRDLADARGALPFTIVRRGGVRWLRATAVEPPVPSPVEQLLGLERSAALRGVLAGSAMAESADAVWRAVARACPAAARVPLEHLDRKLVATSDARRDYRGREATVACLLQSVLLQRRVRVLPDPPSGDASGDRLEPYTIVLHRGSVAVVARSERRGRVVAFALEDLHRIELLQERFAYPARYAPGAYVEDAFGVSEDPPTPVEIQVMPGAAPWLASRQVHPSQQLVARRDGSKLLRMSVRGIGEVRRWVLGFGAQMRVLKPAWLRREVADALAAAARAYRAAEAAHGSRRAGMPRVRRSSARR